MTASDRQTVVVRRNVCPRSSGDNGRHYAALTACVLDMNRQEVPIVAIVWEDRVERRGSSDCM
jgi:hypothetical protein